MAAFVAVPAGDDHPVCDAEVDALAASVADRIGLAPLDPYQGIFELDGGEQVHLFARTEDLPLLESTGYARRIP